MPRAAEPVFHEEQSFRQPRVLILVAIPPVAMLLLVIWQVILGHPWGKHPMSNAGLIGWAIFLWLIYFRLVTIRLVTEVRPDEVVVSLRGLWRARHIPLAQIRSATVVVYDPIRDYGGYGFRWTRHGRAYIAGGHQGVRLELTKGAPVLIGSQRSPELADAISRSASA